MRNTFCQAMISFFKKEKFIFLTGDLGFMALEPLRELMGEFFVNAGLAEQNMVSFAAGLTKAGFKVWAYSIAPFIYARPLEQIRNDICLNDLSINLVGNGGGYGYGAMGSSHHAIEDYGILLTLKGMQAYIPAFSDDIKPIINQMMNSVYPSYLRLGLCEKPKDFKLPLYAPWRRLIEGKGPVQLIVGPLSGGILQEIQSKKMKHKPELWVLTELPFEKNPAPVEFINSLKKWKHLIVIEEHVSQGGLGQMIGLWLHKNKIELENLTHFFAKGYPSGLYGSQAFHRKENGLDPKDIIHFWEKSFYKKK